MDPQPPPARPCASGAPKRTCWPTTLAVAPRASPMTCADWGCARACSASTPPLRRRSVRSSPKTHRPVRARRATALSRSTSAPPPTRQPRRTRTPQKGQPWRPVRGGVASRNASARWTRHRRRRMVRRRPGAGLATGSAPTTKRWWLGLTTPAPRLMRKWLARTFPLDCGCIKTTRHACPRHGGTARQLRHRPLPNRRWRREHC